MMLLVHTVGSVKVGEIVRYTVTYTPSQDPILPLPTDLHLRVKNTAALPLRAAYLHGPYTVYVSVRRQEFHPYEPWYEHEDVASDSGIEAPMYDPHLKAGASFYAVLKVPDRLRRDALAAEDKVRRRGSPEAHSAESSEKAQGSTDDVLKDQVKLTKPISVTWIIEIISQTIFSTSATVGFEVMLARDEKSLSYGFPFGPANYASLLGADGNVDKNQNGTGGVRGNSSQNSFCFGVLSSAIKLQAQDTADLWNLPPFPSWSEHESDSSYPTGDGDYPDPDELDEQEVRLPKDEPRKSRKTKNVHLVILTHGLHSNAGADMLFTKEIIDEEGRKMQAQWQKKKEERTQANSAGGGGGEDIEDEEDEREMLIVRGFHGNVCRTERGIKYLGKRLAKYVISLVHPKEPTLEPLQQPPRRQPNKLRKNNIHHPHLTPAARETSSVSVKQRAKLPQRRPFKVTSISFIGHSLGGLVQTYAIAWIHAHHPSFFHEAKPVNFVALATPFLGLSNENPIYVKFALAFGLVGRTGQDLGLAWRAPDMAASLSSAFTSSEGSPGKINGGKADTSKPLLRILPSGPAHEVFKMFRNRTAYANVVNDGVVPLRTSCLLFLDWKGLGRVEKARRENAKTPVEQVAGLVGWGISQLTTSSASGTSRTNIYIGGNMNRTAPPSTIDDRGIQNSPTISSEVCSLDSIQKIDENTIVEAPLTAEITKRESIQQSLHMGDPKPLDAEEEASVQSNNLPTAVSSFLTLFRPHGGKKQVKSHKVMKRSQTLRPHRSNSDLSSLASPSPTTASPMTSRANSPHPTSPASPAGTRAMPALISSYDDLDDPVFAPPKTTILETAGDLLNPPLPTLEFIVDPNSRPRTIFHDRVYHSWEIPPPRQRELKPLLGLKRGDVGEASEAANVTAEALEESMRDDTIPNAHPVARPESYNDSSSNASAPRRNTLLQKAPMKVEEKIARAYHKGLSWRKVLVKLEPDAHNNMIVRRMFANAYGWPVVRHLVDTHFAAESNAAQVPDSEEGRVERAGEHGEVIGGLSEGMGGEHVQIDTTSNDTGLSLTHLNQNSRSVTEATADSGIWSDTAFDVTEYEDDDSPNEDVYADVFSDGEITPRPMESALGTPLNEIDSSLLGTPISEVSRVEVFGRPASCLSIPSSVHTAIGSLGQQSGRTYDVGIGKSTAIRELAKMNCKPPSASPRSRANGSMRQEDKDIN